MVGKQRAGLGSGMVWNPLFTTTAAATVQYDAPFNANFNGD